jgi:hypothetical protein
VPSVPSVPPAEPAIPAVTTGPQAQSRISRLAVGAVALAVVALVLLAVVMQQVSSQTAADHRLQAESAGSYLAGPSAKAAAQAASTEVRATLTYSYKTLHADFLNAEKGLTPAFRTSYDHTTATSVTPLATKYHAVSSASVAGAGVSAATATTATVLLFVDQTVQNTQLPQPRLDRSRIKVAMVKTNGRWLINGLTPL